MSKFKIGDLVKIVELVSDKVLCCFPRHMNLKKGDIVKAKVSRIYTSDEILCRILEIGPNEKHFMMRGELQLEELEPKYFSSCFYGVSDKVTYVCSAEEGKFLSI